MSKYKYIFCINSGRAGSQYLAELLSTAEDVVSLHEPDPQMIGEYLHMVTTQPYAETYTQRRFKVDVIQQILKQSGKQTYIETSHMFIKTFFDVVCNEFDHVCVLYLHRPLFDTLKSFTSLGYFSSKNTSWPDWMIMPNAVTRAIEPAYPVEDMDEIDLSIAYLLDINARAHRFRIEYPHIKVLEVPLLGFNEMQCTESLFSEIGLTMKPSTKKLIGKKSNERENLKQKYNILIDDELLQQRLEQYYGKLQDKGDARGINSMQDMFCQHHP